MLIMSQPTQMRPPGSGPALPTQTVPPSSSPSYLLQRQPTNAPWTSMAISVRKTS